jgi:ribosomal protein S18 acetylase RimI-like enzyme
MSSRYRAFRIVRARTRDLGDALPLFGAYRRFYHRSTDPAAARRYLSARLARGEAILLVAYEGREPMGFTVLYTTFSSLAMRPLWILNDLYVRPPARRRHIATRLLDRAAAEARAAGAVGMILDTARTNRRAQRLYAACGWTRDEKFLHYELTL